MRIVVQGLWHLGSVTAACCARHFDVTGLDFEVPTITGLRAGRAPLREPGLDDLLAQGLASGRLAFTADAATACAGANLLWLTYDTPVDHDDVSDDASVLASLRRALPHLRPGTVVLISSQLPVGTCRTLEQEWPQLHFACSPENLRLGKAIAAFEQAERAIIGLRPAAPRALLEALFAPFAQQTIFMRTESAEMVKHALNSFLALSITFINEIARLCEPTGADAREVSLGLKSEPRIGPRAYLGPGGPFAGGTLARDVVTLSQLGASAGVPLELLPAIKRSNDRHRGWALARLLARFGDLRGRTIAVLGLVYTPGTDTLRRSSAVELCQALAAAGARVCAHDPAIHALPPELGCINLSDTALAALTAADAAVISTEWPEFRQLDWRAATATMRSPVFVDANRFLDQPLSAVPGVEHFSVGRA